jgi:hypothetical protein
MLSSKLAMPKKSRREAELEGEIAALRTAPFPTRKEEHAQVERIREGRRAAEEAEQKRQRAYQERVDLYAALGPSMQPPPAPVLGPSGDFRIEFYEHGQPTAVDYADDYGETLRKTRDGLLGTSGDQAKLFLGKELVNIANLERAHIHKRGTKYIVRFASGGEKPRKRTR